MEYSLDGHLDAMSKCPPTRRMWGNDCPNDQFYWKTVFMFFYEISLHKKPDKALILYQWDCDRLKKYEAEMARHHQYLKDLGNTGDVKWAFITIGWNDEVVTPSVMRRYGQQIKELPYWDTIQLVHEKYRLDGIHHHTHFLVFFRDNYKSSLINKLFALKGIKKFIYGKQSIDYRDKRGNTTLDTYRRYIVGDKTAEKLPCVEKDKIWRKENNLD